MCFVNPTVRRPRRGSRESPEAFSAQIVASCSDRIAPRQLHKKCLLTLHCHCIASSCGEIAQCHCTLKAICTCGCFMRQSRTKHAPAYPARMFFREASRGFEKKVITYYLKTPFFPISANLAVFCRSVRRLKKPCGLGWGRFCTQNCIEVAWKIACVNGP